MVAAVLSGCAGASSTTSGTSIDISKNDLGEDWPLTVDAGTLSCENGAVTFESGGTQYAVNGMAGSRDIGVDIEPIWADDPSGDAPKVSIGPLIQRGLVLCER